MDRYGNSNEVNFEAETTYGLGCFNIEHLDDDTLQVCVYDGRSQADGMMIEIGPDDALKLIGLLMPMLASVRSSLRKKSAACDVISALGVVARAAEAHATSLEQTLDGTFLDYQTCDWLRTSMESIFDAIALIKIEGII